MSQGPADPEFLPTASWPRLRLRAELLGKVRAFFDQRGFLEVETPLLSVDTVVDRYLDPLAVVVPDDPRRPERGRPMWLQTSPEFAMKRLLAAGGEAIYQITRAFRAGERGPLHNPEFTIVEWYRRGEAMDEAMGLLSDVCEALLGLGPAERISYAQAFERHAGLDPHTASVDELAAAARRAGIHLGETASPPDRDGWLNVLLAVRVEPQLGLASPAILYDYPASQAALAVERGPVAERFELYVRGIELANGYHELTDAAALRARIARANALRVADGKPALPADNRLLAAMEAGLPASSGVALGFDRVAMLAAGAASISEVIAFPIERA
jgi:lysyl-tRNA synthetase class 2